MSTTRRFRDIGLSFLLHVPSGQPREATLSKARQVFALLIALINRRIFEGKERKTPQCKIKAEYVILLKLASNDMEPDRTTKDWGKKLES